MSKHIKKIKPSSQSVGPGGTGGGTGGGCPPLV